MDELNTIGEMELLRLARDRLEELCQEETDDEARYILEEQYEEISDIIASRERLAERSSMAETKRLKVEDKYGSWYYHKMMDEETRTMGQWTRYYLYDSDGSYVDEFRTISAMKHYVRTGKRA